MLPMLIPIAIQLATKFAPALIGKLMGDKAEDVAEKVIDMGMTITGQKDPDKILEEIDAKPELAIQYKESLLEYRVAIEQEETKRIQAEYEHMSEVNKTIQAEVMHGKGWKAGWRPYNGYLFGTTIFFDYFVSQIVIAVIKGWVLAKNAEILAANAAAIVTEFTFTWAHIPDSIYIFWSAVLGVSAASRGVEKVKQAGGIGSILAMAKNKLGM